MKRVGLHFPRLFKILLWTLLLVSYTTGLVWLYLHRWGLVTGEFGEEHSSWEPILMKIHGGMATLMEISFGYLLATHITVAWRAKRNRILGFALVALLSLMILTGYVLYYASDELLRSCASWVHLIMGLSLPILLLWHILLGRRGRRQAHNFHAVSQH